MTMNREKIRRPEIFFKDLLEKEAIGAKTRFFYRAQVISVDLKGGQLQNQSGQGTVDSTDHTGKRSSYKASIGPENPAGSIKARILNDRIDSLNDDAQTKIFWPLFSFDQASSAPLVGEHVLIVFESTADVDHGYWVSRVPGHDNQNFFEGRKSYTSFAGDSPSAIDSFDKIENDSSDKEASEAPPVDLIGLF